jgi:hypothetical protein
LSTPSDNVKREVKVKKRLLERQRRGIEEIGAQNKRRIGKD